MVKEFHLQQGWNAFADNYVIQIDGKDCYKVKGHALKLGIQSSFETMDGTELSYIKQTTKTLAIPWNSYEWFKDGKPWASVKQNDWGSITKKEIEVDIPGENDYKIKGDNMSWNFTIHKGDVEVGQISKSWGVRDNYGVRVEDDADEVDVLMCAILVDATYHNNKGKRR